LYGGDPASKSLEQAMTRCVTAYALLLALGLLPATPACAAEPEARTVSVSGQGEVRAEPDRATVTLGVLARESSLGAARTAANRVLTALLELTRRLQIPSSAVRSTRLSVNPEYNWDTPQHARQLTGYSVQRQLVVDLRDLEQLGELLEQGVSAGANLVSEPVLDSSRRAELEREALARAVEDARRNAAVLAAALDARVGPVRSVAMTGTAVPPPLPMMRAALASAPRGEAPQTYQLGELSFSAGVTASFDLLARTSP
jgi:uncharacterized protein YggE